MGQRGEKRETHHMHPLIHRMYIYLLIIAHTLEAEYRAREVHIGASISPAC
jgi:hypothetical protein